MIWNWQRADWPAFRYDAKALEPFERRFLLRSGEILGAFQHVGTAEQDVLRIELISEEAVKTSEIEGEILNRDSVQSSLRHQFGLGPERPGVPLAERGIASMMVDLYSHFDAPLTRKTLCAWHGMLFGGDRSLEVVGGYRTHVEAMQIVSGSLQKPAVYFEAPASKTVPDEMARFTAWFNDSAPQRPNALPALTRAGIAHLYFVCIHPFEDGNGRIGRAVAEKALAQSLDRPSLIALAYAIQRSRKSYYAALERNNKEVEVTDWLKYFAETVQTAQATTMKRIEFSIDKTRFYERLGGRLNERQAKVIARMFREGIDGFKGGLSAANYVSITGASRATTTRDLQDLVEKGALGRTGTLRHSRYSLTIGTHQT